MDLRYEQFWRLVILLMRIGKWNLKNARGIELTWQIWICDMSNFEDLSFFWWELTSEVWSARGIVLTWQVWICDMSNFEGLPFYWWELASEVLKCQRYSVNLAIWICDMSNFEDLSFYWWELTSEVWSAWGIVLTWQSWRLTTPYRVDK